MSPNTCQMGTAQHANNQSKQHLSDLHDNTARSVRAGSHQIMTYEERREFLKTTRLGALIGLKDSAS